MMEYTEKMKISNNKVEISILRDVIKGNRKLTIVAFVLSAISLVTASIAIIITEF